MEATTYEGWSNKPTWAVNLWIMNEEPLYRAQAEMVRHAIEHAPTCLAGRKPDEALADQIKVWVEEDLVPDLGATMAADLLTWAVAHVNWLEIARTWIEDEQQAQKQARKSKS